MKNEDISIKMNSLKKLLKGDKRIIAQTIST
ncbi:unnamed protein product, partial [marine sediment metagenome]